MLAHASAWVGTLPVWLLLVGLCVAAWVMRGSKSGEALAYYRESNAALALEIDSLKERLAAARTENAALRTRTDLEPLRDAVIGAVAALGLHEERAAQRTDSQLAILNMIATRLGPDPNNHDT